jgi:WD40 repeat protein
MRHFEPDYRHHHSDHLTGVAWQPACIGRQTRAGRGEPSGCLAVTGGDGLIAVHAPGRSELLWQTRFKNGGLDHLGWSPDGRTLAIAGQHSRVELRDGGSGEIIARPLAGRGDRSDWVTALAWSGAGTLAVAAGKRVSLWSAAGELLADCDGAASTVNALCWSGDRLIGSQNGGLLVWEATGGALKGQRRFPGPLLELAVSPDQRWIASAGFEPVCMLWPAEGGEPLSMAGFGARVRSLSWAADSSALATASDAEVIVWHCSGEGPAGRKPLIIPALGHRVEALAWHPSEPWLVSADQGGIAVVCALPAGRPLMAHVDEEALTSVAWCRDAGSSHLAITTAEGSLVTGPMPAG